PQSDKGKGSRDSVLKQKSYISSEKKLKTDRSPSDDEEDAYGLHSNSLVRFTRSLCYAIVSQSEVLCYSLVVINQIINGSLLSLPLPLMVFMWGCLSVPRPTKTFWISVITYTEVIVIAKYIFNFRWVWKDVGSIPGWFPRFIGVEESVSLQYYFDLALLLVLFFHRFMLKTLGLWDLEVDFIKPKSKEASVDGTLSSPMISKEETVSRPGLRKRKVPTPPQSSPSLKEDEEKCEDTSEDADDIGEGDTVFQVLEASASFSETVTRIFRPIEVFFQRILHPDFRIARDLYSPMFFCDFINFFIVVFGYNSFGSGNSTASITTYFEENRVPILFLLMLLAQFLCILIDRALYLRKNIKGRLIFHVIIVVIIHLWLFIVLPSIADKQSSPFNNTPPKLWYIFKAIYLLLSAKQIKSGYPTRILGNCFAKKYSILNLYLFKGYTMIPFLYDMRLIMDWVWTDSSLNLEEWAIMEDMFKQLFERKCTLNFEAKFPEPEGLSRRRPPKYFHGGAYLLMIILAIWIPLVLFALGSTVGSSLNPVTASITIEFVGYQRLFKMSATGNQLMEINAKDWKALNQKFDDANAASFLTNYDQT
ncbi:piezo-type mechanosensitive ion channel component 2-like protein, partial [Leptotrombidium deliense]